MKFKSILLSFLFGFSVISISLPAIAQIGNCNLRDRLVVSYEGGCKDGRRDGIGTLIAKNGERYEGGWSNNKMSGTGTYTYKNGDRYEGDWKDNNKEGTGTYTFSIGERYEGGWSNNKRNGTGTYTYKNGDQYEGSWKDDKRDGTGTLTLANGDRYEGNWKDDKKNGIGTFTYRNGYRSQGLWKDDNKDDSEEQVASKSDFILPPIKACKPYDGLLDNKDGTLTDPRTDLVWNRCDLGTQFVKGKGCIGEKKVFTWVEAMRQARENNFGGFNNWRLPTKSEVVQIVANSNQCGGYHVHNTAAVDLRLVSQKYYDSNHDILTLDVSPNWLGDIRSWAQPIRWGHSPMNPTGVDINRERVLVKLVRQSNSNDDPNLTLAKKLFVEMIEEPEKKAKFDEENARIARNKRENDRVAAEKEKQRKLDAANN